jgi:hypothetical protein
LSISVLSQHFETGWYKGASHFLTGKQFNLILIDGPDRGLKGTDFVPFSRAGILEYLPAILDNHWIVVFDDAERFGEIMTITAFQSILQECKRPFLRFDIHGVKTQTVFCSPSYSFLQSV